MNCNHWSISKFYVEKTVVLDKSITYSLEEGDILREIATIGGGSHVKAWGGNYLHAIAWKALVVVDMPPT